MTSALVISSMFPVNEQSVNGVYQRLQIQVEALAGIADRIDCLFLTAAHFKCSPEDLIAHEERLRRRWSPKVCLRLACVVPPRIELTLWQRYGPGIFDYHSQDAGADVSSEEAVRAVRAALRAAPDLILAHRLPVRALLMKLFPDTGRTPVFFDLDDVEHVVMSRRLLRHPAWPKERLLLLQIPRLLLTEIQAIRRSRLTFVCSERDCRQLQRLACSRRVEVVANSISLPNSSGVGASAPIVLFVGTLNWEPNRLAADTLVQQIWPTVRARVPNARLMIVGLRPDRLQSYPAKDPSVTFTGFVDDLAGLYGQARVVCCPITYGGGTRIKIIEAAAHARAVVSTTLGAEGLMFENEKEIILRDDPAALAAECVRLLLDPAAAERLGVAARAKARATYDRNAVLARLQTLFSAGLQASSGARLLTPG